MTATVKMDWDEHFRAISSQSQGASFGSDFSSPITDDLVPPNLDYLLPKGATKRPDYDPFGAEGASASFAHAHSPFGKESFANAHSPFGGGKRKKRKRSRIGDLNEGVIVPAEGTQPAPAYDVFGDVHEDSTTEMMAPPGYPDMLGDEPLSSEMSEFGYGGHKKHKKGSKFGIGVIDLMKHPSAADPDYDEFGADGPEKGLLPAWLLAILGLVAIWGGSEYLAHKGKQFAAKHSQRVSSHYRRLSA